MTSLGLYVLAAMAFDFFAIFEYAAILCWRRRNAIKRWREKRRIRNRGIKKLTVTFKYDDSSRNDINCDLLREAIIDQGVFVIYICLFLLFNIAYFIYFVIIGPKH